MLIDTIMIRTYILTQMKNTKPSKAEALLDSALDLFWSKGYKSCSMADVVRKTGVARYGLYQAFKDKDQLYCATLKRYHQRLRNRFIKPLSDKRSSFTSLVQHFDRVLEQLEHGKNDGCFAHQAAIERGGKDDNVDMIISDIFNETEMVYKEMVSNGIEDGLIRPLPINELVVYVMGIQRAVIAMTKQKCSIKERQDYVHCALKLLQPEKLLQTE